MKKYVEHSENYRDSGLYDAEDFQYEDFGEDYEYDVDSYDEDFDDDDESSELQSEIVEIQEMYLDSIEGMSSEEMQEFSTEFIGALASALPAVIGAAPGIIRGIGSIFGGRRRRRRRRRPRRRPTPVRRRGPSTAASVAMLSRKIDRLITALSRR